MQINKYYKRSQLKTVDCELNCKKQQKQTKSQLIVVGNCGWHLQNAHLRTHTFKRLN